MGGVRKKAEGQAALYVPLSLPPPVPPGEILVVIKHRCNKTFQKNFFKKTLNTLKTWQK